jgi:hypothetical protein
VCGAVRLLPLPHVGSKRDGRLRGAALARILGWLLCSALIVLVLLLVDTLAAL